MTTTDRETNWGVWCVRRVGVCEHREAWLKKDGQEWAATEQQARNEAKRLNDKARSFTLSYHAQEQSPRVRTAIAKATNEEGGEQ